MLVALVSITVSADMLLKLDERYSGKYISEFEKVFAVVFEVLINITFVELLFWDTAPPEPVPNKSLFVNPLVELFGLITRLKSVEDTLALTTTLRSV